MAYENPENIIRSWNIQGNFATGPVTADQLVPPQYGRIRTPFLNTWREEQCNSTLDWGSSNFSIYLPESLRFERGVFTDSTSGARIHDIQKLSRIIRYQKHPHYECRTGSLHV